MSNIESASTGLTTAQKVALNLAQELHEQRWSARQAAFKLGLNPMYVTRRTSGDVECTASDLEVFADLLNVPITRFFEEPKEPTTDYRADVLEFKRRPSAPVEHETDGELISIIERRPAIGQ